MDITINHLVLYIAILLTGLSAGFFYAWQVSVIPGTKRVQDWIYIETMQKINRAIINPLFMLVFLGPLIIQLLSIYFYWNTIGAFRFITVATALYGAGTLLVTGLGNVPLNDALDVLKPNTLSEDRIRSERRNYESRWNRLHVIRTVFSVFSFMILLAAAFISA